VNNKRLYFGLLGLIGLLFIALLAGVYGANGLLTSQANNLTDLKAKSQALMQEQQSLVKAKKDIQKYANLEKIAKAVVPEDKSQAEAIREIVNIAAANGVTLGSITFPTSTLGANISPIGTNTSTSANNPPAAAAGGPKASLSQLIPVKGIAGVYQLAITIASNSQDPIQYNQLISFLNDLEHNRRTAQVNSINLQPAALSRNNLSFTLILNEYIKP
jgi:hypothetical protein